MQDFDHRIFVKFLPPNVTAVIQPMDQGVINAFKSIYKRLLTEEMVQFVFKNGNNLEKPFETFLKEYNLLKAIKNIGKAWSMAQRETIIKSFNKVVDVELMVKTYKDRIENTDVENFEGFIENHELMGITSPIMQNIRVIQNIINTNFESEPFTEEDITHYRYSDQEKEK